MKLLSTKIFIINLAVIVLLTGLIMYFTIQSTWSHYFDRVANDLKNTNITLVEMITPFVVTGSNDQLSEVVKKITDKTDIRITIIDTSGAVLSDSRYQSQKMDNHIDRPEVINALANGFGIDKRYSYTLSDEMLYVAMPITNGGEVIAVSRLSLFVKDINVLTRRIAIDILQIALVVVVIALISVLIFTRNTIRPLNNLAKAASAVSAGDFNVHVKAKGRDEIAVLTRNFNNMASRLKNLFEQVSTQKEEYHTLISSIREGLIVIDNEGKILLSNESFNKIFGNENVKNWNYRDLTSQSDFLSFIDDTIRTKIGQNREIDLNNHTFLCSSNVIGVNNQFVVVLHDITERKSLEKIKRDFVINVSHELKTPLTAIKGFVETLEDELEGEQENLHYLIIIKRHTERLINIVRDLLILSELEKEETSLLLNKVDLRELISNVVMIFEQKLSEKSLKFEFDIESDFPILNVDVFRFEQVIVNMIDNAIKYTDEGKISIHAIAKDNQAIIRFSDTGVGISKEDQSRIFERFYIVDKSRSKRVGGTGLGLSIVKHIVLLHGGTINIESTKEKGTTFTISIPLNLQKTAG